MEPLTAECHLVTVWFHRLYLNIVPSYLCHKHLQPPAILRSKKKNLVKTPASYVKNIFARTPASYVKAAKCVPFQSYTQGKSTGSRRLSTKVAHFVAVLLQSSLDGKRMH